MMIALIKRNKIFFCVAIVSIGFNLAAITAMAVGYLRLGSGFETKQLLAQKHNPDIETKIYYKSKSLTSALFGIGGIWCTLKSDHGNVSAWLTSPQEFDNRRDVKVNFKQLDGRIGIDINKYKGNLLFSFSGGENYLPCLIKEKASGSLLD